MFTTASQPVGNTCALKNHPHETGSRYHRIHSRLVFGIAAATAAKPLLRAAAVVLIGLAVAFAILHAENKERVRSRAFEIQHKADQEQVDDLGKTPAATAYTDGFETVVFDLRAGAPTNVRSLELKDAEAAIAAGSQALLPDDVKEIEKALTPETNGDSNVHVDVRKLDNNKQRVRLGFHQSMRTYVYEYDVDGTKLTPVRSEYRDLGKSKTVRYSN